MKKVKLAKDNYIVKTKSQLNDFKKTKKGFKRVLLILLFLFTNVLSFYAGNIFKQKDQAMDINASKTPYVIKDIYNSKDKRVPNDFTLPTSDFIVFELDIKNRTDLDKNWLLNLQDKTKNIQLVLVNKDNEEDRIRIIGIVGTLGRGDNSYAALLAKVADEDLPKLTNGKTYELIDSGLGQEKGLIALNKVYYKFNPSTDSK